MACARTKIPRPTPLLPAVHTQLQCEILAHRVIVSDTKYNTSTLLFFAILESLFPVFLAATVTSLYYHQIRRFPMDPIDWGAFLTAPPSSELSQGAGLDEICGFYGESQESQRDADEEEENAIILQEDDLPALSGVEEVIETAESAPAPQFPALPPSAMYNSFNDLMDFLQAFHRENGAAIRIKRSSNPREINGETIPTYYALLCDRAGSQTSTSVGIRRSSTQRVDCPYKITASATKRTN